MTQQPCEPSLAPLAQESEATGTVIRPYDYKLVDYNSVQFEQGFAIGKAQAGYDRVIYPANDPALSDVEWASLCEGILMGSYEREVIEYADMTDEQKRIVDASQTIAGTIPQGLTRDKLAQWMDEFF